MGIAKGDSERDLILATDNAFPFAALHDVNTRCVELLTHAARHTTRPALSLVVRLGPVLRSSTPEIRRRAAERSFLLVDMEFHDSDWWQGVRREPQKRWRTHGVHEAFPRRSAVPLARSTLVLAWHSIQADFDAACVLLGMTRSVAETIASLKPSELDRIAERRHRHLIPRWHDRPDFWNQLFVAAQSGNASQLRLIDLHALQLLTGPLLPRAGFGQR